MNDGPRPWSDEERHKEEEHRREHSRLSWRKRRLLGRPLDRDTGVLEGDGFFYRPGQLLVAEEHLEGIRNIAAEFGARPHEQTNALLRQYDVPIVRLDVPLDVDVLALTKRIRSFAGGGAAAASVNHVFSGEPNYLGGPGTAPRPAQRREIAPTREQDGVRVAVLDTGLIANADALHPEMAGRYAATAQDVDLEDVFPPAGLDLQAGHGTFVASVVLQCAPGAAFDAVKVLDSDGVGDDVSVALGLARSKGAAVLNLSLGGYTCDDQAPLALSAALARTDPGVAVVAAAGNNASSRLFWPAAFKRVIAVGALDTRGASPVRAWFSNYGWWVDACAPGVDIGADFTAGVYRLDEDHTIEDFKGFARWSGTSFATPIVSGVIAAASDPSRTPRETAARLLNDPSAQRIHDLGVMLLPNADLLTH